MKALLLMISLATFGNAQIKSGQCGASPVIARNPALGGRADAAAKPEGARAQAPAVLPQIQSRRPTRFPGSGCWCGSVGAASLTSSAPSQELTIVNGLSGNFRLEHFLIQEAKQFTSDLVGRLSVTVRPKIGGDLISEFALKSDTTPQNFATVRPAPAALTGTYDLVLKFTGSSPLAIEGSSNFSAGLVSWELCGYQVQ